MSPHRLSPRVPDRALHLITRAGLVCLVGTLGAFLALSLVEPEPYRKVWQLVAVHFVGGRAGNVSLGLTYGFNRWFLLFQCMIQDVTILLLVYPVFVRSLRHAVRVPVLGPFLARLHAGAERHRHRIEPYGAIGLVAFVVFPFWSTGALMGAVVGHLIGMRISVAFTSILTGNLAAVTLWVLFFDWLHRYNATVVKGVLLGAVIAGLVALAWHRVRRTRTPAPPVAPAELDPAAE